MNKSPLLAALCATLLPAFAVSADATIGSWTNPGKSVTQQVYRDLQGVLEALRCGDFESVRPFALEPELMESYLEPARKAVQYVEDADQHVALIGLPFPDRRAFRDVFTLTGPFFVSEPSELKYPVEGEPSFHLEPGAKYYLLIGMTNEPGKRPESATEPVYRLQTPPIPMTEDEIIKEISPRLLQWNSHGIGSYVHSITPEGERIKRKLLSEVAKKPVLFED